MDGPTNTWAVSQATALRRVHVRGDLSLWEGGWSSGGFLADCVVDGQVTSGSQQQWLSRNAAWGGWRGANWNMVFVGVSHPPSGRWPDPPYTVIERTPRIREKPFLGLDREGRWVVRVPGRLREGTQGASWVADPGDPVCLWDLFCRVGGAGAGAVDRMVEVNRDGTVADHLWLWRADHGAGVGWTTNPARTGLVVRGKDVTIYGLFVEHAQEAQTVWSGEGGSVFFYQSELPYDPPGQAEWRRQGRDGYPSYEVDSGVATHQAWGLGIYSFFTVAPVVCESAVEAPERPGVRIRHVVTVRLGGKPGSGIRHGLNRRGDAVLTGGKAMID